MTILKPITNSGVAEPPKVYFFDNIFGEDATQVSYRFLPFTFFCYCLFILDNVFNMTSYVLLVEISSMKSQLYTNSHNKFQLKYVQLFRQKLFIMAFNNEKKTYKYFKNLVTKYKTRNSYIIQDFYFLVLKLIE